MINFAFCDVRSREHLNHLMLLEIPTIHYYSWQNIHPWLEEEEGVSKFQCFPLVSVLMALTNEGPESGSRDHSRPIRGPRVNLLSLDIEGAEFEVFKTIPWDKVDIEVIVTELVHAGEVRNISFVWETVLTSGTS